MNGAAGLGELKPVPKVLEAKALLDDDAEPRACALHEELVKNGGEHEEDAVHGSLEAPRRVDGWSGESRQGVRQLGSPAGLREVRLGVCAGD